MNKLDVHYVDSMPWKKIFNWLTLGTCSINSIVYVFRVMHVEWKIFDEIHWSMLRQVGRVWTRGPIDTSNHGFDLQPWEIAFFVTDKSWEVNVPDHLKIIYLEKESVNFVDGFFVCYDRIWWTTTEDFIDEKEGTKKKVFCCRKYRLRLWIIFLPFHSLQKNKVNNLFFLQQKDLHLHRVVHKLLCLSILLPNSYSNKFHRIQTKRRTTEVSIAMLMEFS